MSRKQKRSPAADRRKAKRAEKRIEENSKRRSHLMHMQGGEGKPTAAISEGVRAAERRRRGARVPARVEIAALTQHLAEDFTDDRENRKGTIPLPPKGPPEMREENGRSRKPKKREWKGA